MGLFKPEQKFPASSSALQNILTQFERTGSAPGPEGQALSDLFNAVSLAEKSGQPFFQSLIPIAPGQLSPAAAAEKASATQGLNTALGSAKTSMIGDLARQYGGRLPASMLTSGFGNLARSASQGATDIGRQAIQSNVGYGIQGAQGLESLGQLASLPSQVIGGLTGAATSGGWVQPSGFSSIAGPISQLAGAATGFMGGGGGGSTSSSGGFGPTLGLGGVNMPGIGGAWGGTPSTSLTDYSKYFSNPVGGSGGFSGGFGSL